MTAFCVYENNPTNDLGKSIHPFPLAIPQEKEKREGGQGYSYCILSGLPGARSSCQRLPEYFVILRTKGELTYCMFHWL